MNANLIASLSRYHQKEEYNAISRHTEIKFLAFLAQQFHYSQRIMEVPDWTPKQIQQHMYSVLVPRESMHYDYPNIYSSAGFILL